MTFNKCLEATLEGVQAIQRTLNDVRIAILDGQSLQAVDLVGQVEGQLDSIGVPRSTRVAGVLDAKIANLRNDVLERLTDCWKARICVDSARSAIKISRSFDGRSPALSDCVPGSLLSRPFYHGYSNVGNSNDQATTV